MRYWNRTAETTTTTGTGDLTLDGPLTGMQAIPEDEESVFAVEVGAGGVDGWEIFRGTRTGNILTRGTLIESSTGNRLDLPTGEHTVLHSPDADHHNSLEDMIQSPGETVHTASSGDIDRNNGGIQEYTLTADETISVTMNNGQSLTLHLSAGDSYTVTWPTMTWVSGSAPTLTADDVIEFWQVGSTLYGAYVGSVA